MEIVDQRRKESSHAFQEDDIEMDRHNMRWTQAYLCSCEDGPKFYV